MRLHLDRRYAPVASDACVSFRTTAVAVEDYDVRSVATTLAADFERHRWCCASIERAVTTRRW
jgi:hypothetical protein